MATVNLPIASNPTSTPVRYSRNGGSWSDAFAGLNYTALPGAPTTDIYTDTSQNGAFVQVGRQFLQIDTSSIPIGAIITAASFTMTADGANRNDDSVNIVLIPTILTSLTTLAQADRSNWTMGTSLGSASGANWVTGGSTASITLNAAGIANINKGGTTYMGMVTSFDVSQTTPPAINSFSMFSNTGTTPPFLTVTYTPPALTNVKTVNGVALH